MSLRHLAREIAFQVLYRYDHAVPSALPSGSALEEDVERHFNHFQVEAASRAFARVLVLGVLGQKTDLDAKIQAVTPNWRMERMGSVDRNILRMGAYELLYIPNTPRAVVLDEAIEIAKRFGNADSPKFVNGVLDAMGKPASSEPPAEPPASAS